MSGRSRCPCGTVCPTLGRPGHESPHSASGRRSKQVVIGRNILRAVMVKFFLCSEFIRLDRRRFELDQLDGVAVCLALGLIECELIALAVLLHEPEVGRRVGTEAMLLAITSLADRAVDSVGAERNLGDVARLPTDV